MFRNKVMIGLLACSAFLSGPALAESLTPDSIVQMTTIGMGDDAIIAKIKADGGQYNLSVDQMIALKQKGVSSSVIAAMVSNKANATPAMSLDSPDPAVPHPAGLYLLVGEGAAAKMIHMDATTSNQAKTGGILGYALTGGIASMSVKVSIQNATARVKSIANPQFYFFFDQSPSGAWASGQNAVVSSPAEFTLIKLAKKEGRREARVGSLNIAGAKTGVMDSDRIAFDQNEIRPGVYKVSVPNPLPSGEYGFIYSLSGANNGGAATAHIYDFSVQ